jgi:hypothetical protein
MFVRAVWALLLLTALANGEDRGQFDTSKYHIREILLSIFQSTGGFSWVNSSNWLSQNADVCQFHGITCYPDDYSDGARVGQVQELNLIENRLIGLCRQLSLKFHIWRN